MAKTASNPTASKIQFICNYRQQGPRKAGKGSSEKQKGQRKRWYEQFYRPDDPAAAGLPKNRFGMCYKRVAAASKGKCRLAA